MRSPSQQDRPIGVETKLPSDTLLLRGISGTERMGRLFQYELDLLSQDAEIDFSSVIGERMTAWIEDPEGDRRFVNGVVTRFEFLGRREDDMATYRATLRPWFWLLSRTADCRIFQEKSIPDIVEEVFGEHGFSDYDLRLKESYEPVAYCVQYRETTFNFVSRLLEEEGIYYFFEHADGKHTLVLCDDPTAHSSCPADSLPYRVPSDARVGESFVGRWSAQQRVQPGRYAIDSYDFEAPRKDLAAALETHPTHPEADYEIFDYPEPHLTPAGGDRYAKVRIQEQQTEQEVFSGATNSRGVTAGATLEVLDPPRGGTKKYLVIGLTLEASAGGFSSGSSGELRFDCRFEAIGSERPFRAARSTPKPVVQGSQTAVVVGKSGEEIWTDKYGRVKVQFHWDRQSKSDESSSCWVRVAQSWAAKSWGGLVIPRIGQEVVISFLEGDPDRPLVIGCVYNGDNMPPNSLPQDATRSTFKSNSSKGGGGFNELTFEDKKDKELIFLHGQKDQEVKILNDTRRDIGNDRTSKIGRDDKMEIGRDRIEDVKRHEELSIAENRTTKIGKDDDRTVDGKDNHKITKDQTIKISASQNVKVTRKITIDAGDQITLKSGASQIVLKKDGSILIKGVKIKIDAAAKIDAKANAQIGLKSSGQLQLQGMMTQVKGTMLDLKGDAMATLKGAITMIG